MVEKIDAADVLALMTIGAFVASAIFLVFGYCEFREAHKRNGGME